MKNNAVALSDSRGIEYWVWPEIPQDRIPEERHVNQKVWVAGYMMRDHAVLQKTHEPGTPLWPQGGYTVVLDGENRYFLKEQVMLHPDLFVVPKVLKKRGRKKKIKNA